MTMMSETGGFPTNQRCPLCTGTGLIIIEMNGKEA